MTYQTYEIAYQFKDTLKFCEVVACDINAALADCKEAGFDVVSVKLI